MIPGVTLVELPEATWCCGSAGVYAITQPEQAELLQNVFRLSDKTVRDCMVPREKVATLELTTPPEKVLEIVRAGAHTRRAGARSEPARVGPS